MKRQLALAILAALVALPSFPAWGSDGDILMVATLPGTADQSGFECSHWRIRHNRSNGNTPFGSCTPPTVSVYAELKGASAGGITGVEWGVHLGGGNPVSPQGYIMIPSPKHNASTVLGNAWLAPRGENLTWDVCQPGDANGRILLYEVLLFNTAPCGPSQAPPELALSGGEHASPGNPFFRCPLFTLCDAPAFTKVCLGDNLTACRRNQPPFPNDATCSSSGSFVVNAPSSGVGQCNPPPGKLASNGSIENHHSSWGNVKALYR